MMTLPLTIRPISFASTVFLRWYIRRSPAARWNKMSVWPGDHIGTRVRREEMTLP